MNLPKCDELEDIHFLVAVHGGALLIRNAGNPVSRPEDPILRYGSNTGNTTRNAQILRQNMEKAGVQAPPSTPMPSQTLLPQPSSNTPLPSSTTEAPFQMPEPKR